MPSARARHSTLAGTGAVILAAALLSGCTTTQTTAARLRLNSARIVEADNSTRVTANAATVSVRRVNVVRSHGRSAAIVVVTNPRAQGVSDLPISVGYTLDGRRTYLNGAAGLSYFSSHLPVIAGHQTITWVFSTGRRIPARARLFVHVGAKPAVPVGTVTSVPDLSVKAGAATSRAVKVLIHNTSGVPQYQLQVYYVGRHGSRVVTAGNLTVSYIGSGSTQTVNIRPAGAVSGAALRIEAVPTIFK